MARHLVLGVRVEKGCGRTSGPEAPKTREDVNNNGDLLQNSLTAIHQKPGSQNTRDNVRGVRGRVRSRGVSVRGTKPNKVIRPAKNPQR